MVVARGKWLVIHLVPKLPFGNGVLRNSVSHPNRNRVSSRGVPKQEFGNEKGAFPIARGKWLVISGLWF